MGHTGNQLPVLTWVDWSLSLSLPVSADLLLHPLLHPTSDYPLALRPHSGRELDDSSAFIP